MRFLLYQKALAKRLNADGQLEPVEIDAVARGSQLLFPQLDPHFRLQPRYIGSAHPGLLCIVGGGEHSPSGTLQTFIPTLNDGGSPPRI